MFSRILPIFTAPKLTTPIFTAQEKTLLLVLWRCSQFGFSFGAWYASIRLGILGPFLYDSNLIIERYSGFITKDLNYFLDELYFTSKQNVHLQQDDALAHNFRSFYQLLSTIFNRPSWSPGSLIRKHFFAFLFFKFFIFARDQNKTVRWAVSIFDTAPLKKSTEVPVTWDGPLHCFDWMLLQKNLDSSLVFLLFWNLVTALFLNENVILIPDHCDNSKTHLRLLLHSFLYLHIHQTMYSSIQQVLTRGDTKLY